jgi:hypothetical protein
MQFTKMNEASFAEESPPHHHVLRNRFAGFLVVKNLRGVPRKKRKIFRACGHASGKAAVEYLYTVITTGI